MHKCTSAQTVQSLDVIALGLALGPNSWLLYFANNAFEVGIDAQAAAGLKPEAHSLSVIKKLRKCYSLVESLLV